MKMLLEKYVKAVVIEYLLLSGYKAWRQNTGAMPMEYKGKTRFIRFGEPGISDIIGMTKQGKFLAIETKKQGWKPPKRNLKSKEYLHYLDQKNFIDDVNKRGGVGFFATSLEEVINELKKH